MSQTNHTLRSATLAALLLAPCCAIFAADAKPGPTGSQTDGAFHKVVLDSDQKGGDGQWQDTLRDPMELAVAPDGRVFLAERNGTVKIWKPDTRRSVMAARLPVFDGLEDGLLGLAIDPGFATNHWIYLNRSLPETQKDANGRKSGLIRVARFTVRGDEIDLSSEKTLLENRTQRDECCHVGGSLAFDAGGNLYVSCGDNTNPFASDGFAPIDERPGRSPWDAQKSAANLNDLRGGIFRIHPEPDGTVTIPAGNLSAAGVPDTRPEVYVKGCRNPFRISVDPRTGFLYWGDVGPDAGGPNPKMGPAGFDEINQARVAGFFGWPYFIADNKPYLMRNFQTHETGAPFDPAAVVNNSPYNTGPRHLPAPQPALIYYPHGASTRFPVVNGGGGRTAMAGPVYYFDAKLASPHKLPVEFDHTLFIYEWSRNWIIAVHLDGNDRIKSMARFCPKMTFKRPMDLELGPDGCLYLIETGTAWEKNLDSQVVRIEYHPSP